MSNKRSEEFYEGDQDEVLSGKGRGELMQDIMARRWSRRHAIGAGLASGIVLTNGGMLAAEGATPEASPVTNGASFDAISLDQGDDLQLAAGHTAVAFLRWGDPLFADAPEWDINNQTRESQEKQFGYNNDWIGFFPLPLGSNSSDHGLLTVNHEYTNPELMFPGYLTFEGEGDDAEAIVHTSQEIVDVELAAHGLSVVEVKRDENGAWAPVIDSEYNRRITGYTPIEISGPAAGDDALKTSEDASGTQVFGMLNNCAGGQTPWGTILTCEENVNQYFGNLAAFAEVDAEAAEKLARYGYVEEATERLWETFYSRFDIPQEPNEPNRFGWVVEIDPYDPTSTPKKRTALGRTKHEGATSAVTPNGQVAFYAGDDERFDYAYKFVTANAYNSDDRAANADLMDDGTLYVAKFDDDGTGEWLPIVFGEGPLTEENGFVSQADVLIHCRQAGDALGATKMDRPEDFETNPLTGKVYLVCTNNSKREAGAEDAANPRPENYNGHILEIVEDGGDHASTTFTWDVFILAGDVNDAAVGAFYGGHTDGVSSFASPDNITFDTLGNIWISTDGLPNSLEGNDGLFVAATEGPERGLSRQFFSTVIGAECSGPIFTPDNTALFASVQHPGEGGTVEEPVSQWPDHEIAPRPSVVLITNNEGRPVGQ